MSADMLAQVFFMDTLKFFLSLYGHKLPVLSMDISSDSTLLISGSADKNIKIWGLDFGDCHRSIFAHSDSIMQVCSLYKLPFLAVLTKADEGQNELDNRLILFHICPCENGHRGRGSGSMACPSSITGSLLTTRPIDHMQHGNGSHGFQVLSDSSMRETCS